MKCKIEVDECCYCPFRHEAQCWHPGSGPDSPDLISFCPMPDWCPLRKGSAEISLK